MKSLVSADKIAGASDIRARSGPLPPCARRLGTPSVAIDLFRVSRLQPRSSLQRIHYSPGAACGVSARRLCLCRCGSYSATVTQRAYVLSQKSCRNAVHCLPIPTR